MEMSGILGSVIVILIVVGVAALAVRSLWKEHKAGGGCSGNCASCGGCGHSSPGQTKK